MLRPEFVDRGFREFADWLSAIEAEYPVVDWKINGIHAWPTIRLNLYLANFNQTGCQSVGARRVRVLSRSLLKWADATIRDYKGNTPIAAPADVVMLGYSVGWQPQVNGKRVNPLVAPYVTLFETLGRKTVVWETSADGSYNTPRATPSALIQPFLLAQRVRSAAARGPISAQLADYDRFLQHVREDGMRYPYANQRKLEVDFRALRYTADMMKSWLRACGATHGFVADYGLYEQAFCLACAESGVQRVEIQHGVQGRLHAAYGNWRAVPPGGYDTRPDVFWCWDSASADVARHSSPVGHAIAGGDPWLELWRDSNSPLVRDAAAQIRHLREIKPARANVLLTLSYPGELIPRDVEQAILDSPREWSWWIRLHPVHLREQRRQFIDRYSHLEVPIELLDICTRMPLPPLLRAADCHVGVTPTTVIAQAANYGLASVCSGPRAEEAPDLFPEAARHGLLSVAHDPREIVSQVRAALQNPRLEPARTHDSLAALRALLSGSSAPVGRAVTA